MLVSIHFALGAILSAPEMQLGEEEAHNYAEAVQAYARHHDIAAQAKTVDLINLLIVIGGTYGSRFAAIRLRKAAERATAVDREGMNGATAAPGAGYVYHPGAVDTMHPEGQA